MPLDVKAGTVVAFERNGGIFVATYPVLSRARRIGQGQDVSISSDGSRVAYEETPSGPTRHCVVRDVRTGRVLLKTNGAFPFLSPDGRTLAYGGFQNSDWHLRTTPVENTTSASYLNPLSEAISFVCRARKNDLSYPIGWVGNRLMTYSSDFDGGVSVVESGKVIRFIPYRKITGGRNISIPFFGGFSKDLNQVVFEAETGKEGPEGYPETGVYATDLQAGKTRRLPNPPKQEVSHPAWYQDFATFTAYRSNAKQAAPAVCLMNIQTGETRVIVANADRAVFAAGTGV